LMSDKYTIARLTKDKEHFEILVKPEKAVDYRTGKIARITEVLAAERHESFRGANAQSLRNNRPPENRR
jgi:ribosome maturation protein Sdo1